MVTIAQRNTMEKLLIGVNHQGLVLAGSLHLAFHNDILNHKISREDLYNGVFQKVLTHSGKLGSPMYRAIAASAVKKTVDFAKPNLDKLGMNVNHLVSQVAIDGPSALDASGSVLSDFVVSQVRASVFQNYSRPKPLERVANDGACDWCEDRNGLVLSSEDTDISGHIGCGCYAAGG